MKPCTAVNKCQGGFVTTLGYSDQDWELQLDYYTCTLLHLSTTIVLVVSYRANNVEVNSAVQEWEVGLVVCSHQG